MWVVYCKGVGGVYCKEVCLAGGWVVCIVRVCVTGGWVVCIVRVCVWAVDGGCVL